MSENEITVKSKIEEAVKIFHNGSLTDKALRFFQTLGYKTDRQNPFSQKTSQYFKESYPIEEKGFNKDKAFITQWKYIDLLFQISKEEAEGLAAGRFDDKEIFSFLFFAIELTQSDYSRTALSQITREVNKVFPMPVMILFKHGNSLTLSVINRRRHKRDERKDVLEKVTLIKDINIENPHRAHIEILFDLSFDKLKNKHGFTNFVKLHEAWQKTLDTSELNKKFYRELANWYFWAIKNVEFPADEEKDIDIRNAINVIRLITRLIFVWFLKEKGLVQDDLFNQEKLERLLSFKDKNKSTYYKAILQNLFFATLNTEMNKDKPDSRKFRHKAKEQGQRDQHYLIHNVFRYEDYFINPLDTRIKYFDNIPFLNGGLFECLDKKVTINCKDEVIRVDGFSDHPENVLKVPDELFFSPEQQIDLNEIYGTRNKTYKVRGLINILNSYKFTVHENTPVEEEIALDPELLGKGFENLLASYNPETGITARKLTGSFYSPREIVNYMVDEALIAYLQTQLIQKSPKLDKEGEERIEAKLRHLFSYTDEAHQFITREEVNILIEAIDNIKILDPACGSGAFPMGILHKLVYILSKLDPENEQWKQRQINKVSEISDSTMREKFLEDIEQSFQNNELDYGRKLYLIENCIYGVDIQPIAVQIAKLRFFISLIVDQKVDVQKENLGIRPLPNLETKFIAANSLIGIGKVLHDKNEQRGQRGLRSPEIERKEKELEKVRERYFTARTPQTKEKYRKEDERLRVEILELLQKGGWPSETTKQLASWNPYDQNTAANFFDPEWMFGLTDGFDVVIGNPPYVEHKKLKGISSELKKFYSTHSGTADLYVYFYENGIKNLRENGTLVFITSNKFIKTSYGEKLRKYFTNFRVNEIIDFTEVHVFEALVASCIFSVSRRNNSNNKIKIAFANDSLLDFADVTAFVDKNKFFLKQSNLSEKIWQLENETNLALKEKIESGSVTMNETGTINIYRGVTTGFNPAFIIDDEKRKELIKEDKANKTIIKPLLQGRNIRKWNYFKTSDYLIFTRKGIQIKDYPVIKKHLQTFKEQLEPGVGRKQGSYNWYEIQDNTAYYPEFEKEKIIWGLTADKWAFAYDNEYHFLPSNGYILTSKEIPVKYLLALMNSKLMEFYFGFIGIMTAGGAFTLKYETVIEFPIKITDEITQNQIIKLVESILFIKKNPQSGLDSIFFERLIDAMVYELYLPEAIQAAGCEVLKYLGNLPGLKDDWSDEKKMETIEKVYKEISDPAHPVSIAMAKMQEIEEVRIIEGKA